MVVDRSRIKKIKRAVAIFILPFMLIACASTVEQDPSASVFLEGDTLVLHGPADRPAVEQLLNTAKLNPNIRHFRVRSAGGEPMAAMDWGYYLYKHQLSLEVEGYCFDSCANYLFPAAASRTLQPDALVAWSGGVQHESWLYKWTFSSLPGMQAVVGQYLNASARRERRFYHRIMVYQKMNMFGFDDNVGCMNKGNHTGFYYSVADLLMLGIGRVTREGVPWDKTFDHYPEELCRVELDPVEMLQRYYN
ncbi:hypothetical protein CWE15_01140 [Aliidiomarina taiwanensis]|uniref:Lipoprotein n=1 Tax=Aliidiomarina taiwanensis TaxID=946228 RepID=A0A432X8V9_9GAMM|nr:hypothetical protein [Aliidiomarina taiwanensis]RUO43832.1 hypothetical protein CWE15_01140 [Aliidiomarina taiwanensis]